MMDCKKRWLPLREMWKKRLILREKGLASAQKKGSRIAAEGVVASYIHMGGKIGVLVEVNCETDFVAKNEKLLNFVKDISDAYCSEQSALFGGRRCAPRSN